MIKSRLSSAPEIPAEDTKKGFTIIEVMIFLAITGLLLLTVLGGTYASIATQRYNDSVRDFAEFLRQTYAEVISPESIGSVNDDFGGGNSDKYAIYGKVVVFGLNNQTTVYTATLVGNTHIPSGGQDFISELASVKARIFCGIESGGVVTHESTVDEYTPLWETQIWNAPVQNTQNQPFKGTLIIARSPTSGTVHTAFSSDIMPDLTAANCYPTAMTDVVQAPASQTLYNALQNNVDIITGQKHFDLSEVNFCLKSDQSNIVRDIRLAADGHNNTAINIIDDDGGNVCR